MERQIRELSQLGKSIRSIAKALRVSRNTVRRVLRGPEPRFVEAEFTLPMHHNDKRIISFNKFQLFALGDLTGN
jgi:DNA-binding transcriptional regulator YhcF (GntR family)